MLELYGALSAAKAAAGNDGDDQQKKLTPEQQQRLNIAFTIIMIIELILWVWAIIRAVHCSNHTPESRAIHLLFAITSPLFYLIFSYTVPGFCAQSAGAGFRFKH